MDQVRRTAYKSTHVDDIFGPEFDRIWATRPPTSVRRYHAPHEVRTEKNYIFADVQAMTAGELPTTSPGRKSSVPARSTANVPAVRQTASMPALQNTRRKLVETETDIITQRGYPNSNKKKDKPQTHWLVYVGVSMLAMTLGWVLLTSLSGWWQGMQDDWKYGRPRTAHADQVVGHNDTESTPSHFIVTNLKGQIQVIEFPGGDPSKVKIYVGPMLGPGQELTPVVPDFKDVNNDGKLDLVLSAKDIRFIFINENGIFRSLHPDEHYQL